MRHVVLIDARSGVVDQRFPDVEPGARSVVSDGSGGWFVPAESVGSVAVRGIAHLRSDGSLDRSWTARLPSGSRVELLARVGDRLYATVAVGNTVGVDAFEVATAARIWSAPTFRPHIASDAARTSSVQINALAATAARVYVGGAFTGVGGTRLHDVGVVALDAHHGALLGWRMKAPRVEPFYDVEALAAAGSRLYVGGAFGIVAVSARTGAQEPWAGTFGGDDVTAIVATKYAVLVGGTFDFEADDPSTGKPQGWTARLGGSAGTFALAGSTAYLGGSIRSGFGTGFNPPHRGISGNKNNLAAADLATGRFLHWAPHLARYVLVAALAVSGHEVLASGEFTTSLR